jgi:Xaa-Pro aminopeptidase
VKHKGYWAESFVTGVRTVNLVAGNKSALAEHVHVRGRARAIRALSTRTQAALRVALQWAVPGVTGSELHAKAMEALAPYALHPVLSGSIGRRVGLSLNEGGEIRHDSRHEFKLGNVYSLHVGACDPYAGGAISSAMIEIKAQGYSLLHLPPAPDVR